MKRNKFSLSNYHLTTIPMGKLIPINWEEVLPGDTMQGHTSAFIRVTPLLTPVMHPVKVRIHHFYVPYRLLWDDFEDFITGGEAGTSTPTHPYRVTGSVGIGYLNHYLGVAALTYGSAININVLPVRAYQLIWNKYYRDQQLQTGAALSTASGADATTPITIQNVCWEKDYFTSARPDDALGTDVTIPLTGDAPITGLGVGSTSNWQTGPVSVAETDGTGTVAYADYKDSDEVLEKLVAEEDPNNAGYPNIRADLSAVSGVDISDLRLALGLQRYQEARNLYGARYVEYLKYLGISPSDGRLSDPEYIGGGKQTIQFSEVLSTDGANTGDLKGHGVAAMRTNRWRRFFEEHGLIMTMMSVVPKSIYSDAIPKRWWRSTKEDYFQKELAFIGGAEILNKEVKGDHATPDGVFGYQNRYDEYRYSPSRVSGDFCNAAYDHWHYARIFGSDPSLNASFVACEPATRVYASTAYDPLMVMANNSLVARRMIPPKGEGKLVG